MRNFRQKSQAVLVALALGGVMATSTPSHASSYAGKDPMGTPCMNDAVTVASAPITTRGVFGRPRVGVVEVRYSPRCKTAWAKTQSLVGRSNLGSTITGHPRQGGATTFNEYGPFVTSWTKMVSATSGSYVTVRGSLWNPWHTSRQTEEAVTSKRF